MVKQTYEQQQARRYETARFARNQAGLGPAVETEPTKRGTILADRDGDLWRRGTRMWACLAPVDGTRILRAGRLPWSALVRESGPMHAVDPYGVVAQRDS